MKLFKIFDNKTKKDLLIAPLNHPNINYKWIEKKININGNSFEIIHIGTIIDDGSINITKINDEEIGFFDKNNNFVTTILLHNINLKKEGYKYLYEAILEEYKNIKDGGYDKTPLDIKNLIYRLDDDVPFYMDVLKYIRTNKFEFPEENDLDQNDIDELISYVDDHKKDILNDYPHLKLMVNILENRAI